MTFRHCVAGDLGASSRRVMLATWACSKRTPTLRAMHPFANCLQKQDGFDTWDIDALEAEIRTGLNNVCNDGIRIDSIGIDTWGVDYVLLDSHGERVGLPVSYRDSRTDGLMAQAIAQLGKDNIYGRSGIQFLSFNTLYQLRALVEQQPELVKKVAHALLIPDYLSYRLTHPGNVIGYWICPQGNEIPVVAVASHDTASAVIASPLAGKDAAYLSSGTWSLMGFESKTPYTSDAAMAANITNEGGAEGRYRVLKNIMGLWLLQRMLKEQHIADLPALIAETEKLKACTFLINPNDDRFINPVHMSAEIQAACFEAGQPVPSRPAELARCIFDSLALLYADVLSELASLRGKPFSQLHIVGGGCQNQLLNQLCADACGISVVAGPVEASTLGNIGIQLMTLDELSDVDEFRSVVTANTRLTTFTPNPCHEIARYRAQFQQKRLTKELCA